MATPTAQKTNDSATKPANGDKSKAPGTAPGASLTGATAPEGAKEESADAKEAPRAGVIPQMPIAAAWREPSGVFVVALLHPRGGEYKVRGKGLGGTTGSLADEGYPIGSWRTDAPKWVDLQKRIPEGVTVIGYANILGFPVPTQET